MDRVSHSLGRGGQRKYSSDEKDAGSNPVTASKSTNEVRKRKTGKLARSRDALPEWYPLPVYGDSLTAAQWHHEITLRLAILTALRNTDDRKKAVEAFVGQVVKSKYKKQTGSNGLLAGKRNLNRAWPIQELSAFDLAYMAAIMSSHKTGNRILRGIRFFNRQRRSHELLLKAPPLLDAARCNSSAVYSNYRSERVEVSEMVHGVPLTIDITQDDETLKLAFGIWLAGARQILGGAKAPIGDKDFRAWKEYGLLQIFDLDFWGQLRGVRYSDALIAELLWPDAEFDSTERIRKVSRKKVYEIFHDWKFVLRFWRQLELSKYLESIRPGSARARSNAAAFDVKRNKALRRKHRSVVPLTFG
jgi:hypothetical protein